jgi:drug/metabolite transporter (DMT)-like permease
MPAVALSLFSSLSFGVADFLGGLASRRLALLTVLLISQTVGLAGIAAVVAVRAEAAPGGSFVPLGLLAAAFGTIGIAALYRGLAVGAMSVVAPIAATAAVVPVLYGALTGESPTRLQYAGIGLALVGVVLVSWADSPPTGGRRLAGGAGLGMLAAAFIGLFFIAFDGASDEDPYWAAFVLRVGSTSLLAAVALAMRPPLRVPARTAAALAPIGLLDLAGNTLFAVATTKGLIGVVSVLSSLYPVATVALARTVLGERLRTAQAAGVAGAFAGVVLIAAG